MSRMYIQLDDEDFLILAQSAQQASRSTRDQARYLLRLALGLDEPPEATAENSNSAGQVVTDPGAVVDANL